MSSWVQLPAVKLPCSDCEQFVHTQPASVTKQYNIAKGHWYSLPEKVTSNRGLVESNSSLPLCGDKVTRSWEYFAVHNYTVIYSFYSAAESSAAEVPVDLLHHMDHSKTLSL